MERQSRRRGPCGAVTWPPLRTGEPLRLQQAGKGRTEARLKAGRQERWRAYGPESWELTLSAVQSSRRVLSQSNVFRREGRWLRSERAIGRAVRMDCLSRCRCRPTGKTPLLLGQLVFPGRSQEQLQVCPASAAGYSVVLVREAKTLPVSHTEFSQAPDLTCCRTVKALGEIPVSPVVTVTEPSFF